MWGVAAVHGPWELCCQLAGWVGVCSGWVACLCALRRAGWLISAPKSSTQVCPFPTTPLLPVVQAAREDLVEAGWDGVLLGGNYVAGVALGKCVEYGYTFAQEVADHLASSKAAARAKGGSDAAVFV